MKCRHAREFKIQTHSTQHPGSYRISNKTYKKRRDDSMQSNSNTSEISWGPDTSQVGSSDLSAQKSVLSYLSKTFTECQSLTSGESPEPRQVLSTNDSKGQTHCGCVLYRDPSTPTVVRSLRMPLLSRRRFKMAPSVAATRLAERNDTMVHTCWTAMQSSLDGSTPRRVRISLALWRPSLFLWG